MDLAKAMPSEIRTILRLIRRGKLEVGLELDTLEPLLEQLVQSANRLAYALTLAAIVVASSIIIHSNTEPKWHNLPFLGDWFPFMGNAPVIGLMGYLIAIYMAIRLLRAISQRGKL
jgi:ubiquinone biosynthesis protein